MFRSFDQNTYFLQHIDEVNLCWETLLTSPNSNFAPLEIKYDTISLLPLKEAANSGVWKNIGSLLRKNQN